MFWKKKAAHDDEPDSDVRLGPVGGPGASAPPSSPAEYADAALDTVVSMLRALGRYAFDITGVDAFAFRRQCETWAEHLAIGGPHPGEQRSGPPGAAPPRSAERDWIGARHFVLKRRQDEAEYIARSIGDLREVIADLTERLATTLVEDQDTDRGVADQVGRLRAAASIRSLDLLQTEVRTIADLLARLLDERGQRVRSQILELDLKIAALSEELHEVKHESSLDGLTRVFNRSAFDKTFMRLHRVGALSAQPSCLLMTDLDNLKLVNDQYGHRAGDEALRVFADYLVRSFPRRSDFIARYGGDELVVILPQTRLNQSERLAQRFLEGIRSIAVSHGETSFGLTASIGLAELKRGEEADSWLERADKALYLAKSGGRDQMVIAE
ncbi:MAG: GGDEF domain-containing protein [Chloroflexi bacterium]|nr:GGDEF domain-containing protein [Chloroflexota bacterium]